MKKLFTLLFGCVAALQLLAQPCTPDPSLTYPGIKPIKLPDGKVGEFYSEVVSLKVPLDTTVLFNGSPVSARIDSARVIYISYLPKGFSYVCDNANQTWKGGAKGCAKISGTPVASEEKKHLIYVKTQTWFKVIGLSNQFDQIDSSSIDFTITAANSLFESNVLAKFTVYPNPAKDELTLELSKYDAKAKFEVYNLLGSKQNLNYQLNPNTGTVKINTRELSQGVYFVKGYLNGKEWQAKFIKE